MEVKRSYVYRHRRVDSNEIFYIGVGTKKKNKYFLKYQSEFQRAFSSRNRNNWWINITNITDYTVEILLDNLSKEEAEELEILLISEYKRADCCGGSLVNMTDGGGGKINCPHTEYSKNIMREAFKGRVYSEERNRKVSKAHKGKTPWNKGKTGVMSEESNDKRSNSLKGKLPWNTGKELSQEHKDNIKNNCIPRLSGDNVTSKKVLQVSTGKVWDSIGDCAKELGLSYTNLSKCLKGRESYLKYEDFKYYN